MNSLLKLARDQQPNDPRSDQYLTYLLGQKAEQENPGWFEQFPDFATEYKEIKRAMRPGLVDEFKGSFGSAVDNLQATIFGAGAMAADLVGADRIKAYMVEQAMEQERQAAEFQPSVGSYKDVDGLGDAIYYGTYGIALAAPSMAETVALAATSAAIGTAAAPGVGTVAGAAAGVIERTAVKNLIKRYGEKYAKELLADEMKSVGGKIGARAGLALSTIPQAQGEVYNDIHDTEGAAGTALAFGTLSGLLDLIPENYVLGKFFKPGAKLTASEGSKAIAYLKRLGIEATKTAPMEGTTESAQEFIQWAAGKYARNEPATITDADIERFTNAGLIGAIGGLGFAPAAAYSGGGRAAVAPRTPVEDAQEAQGAFSSGFDTIPDTQGVVTPFDQFVRNARSPEQQDPGFGPPAPARASAQAFDQELSTQERIARSPQGAAGLRQDLFNQQTEGAVGQGFDTIPDTQGVRTPIDDLTNPAPTEFDYMRKVREAVLAAQQNEQDEVARSPAGQQEARQLFIEQQQAIDRQLNPQTDPEVISVARGMMGDTPEFRAQQALERQARGMMGDTPEMSAAAERAIQQRVAPEVAPQVQPQVQPTVMPTVEEMLDPVVEVSESIEPTSPDLTHPAQLDPVARIMDLRDSNLTQEQRVIEAKTVSGNNHVNSRGNILIHDRATGRVHLKPFYKSGKKWVVGMSQKRGSVKGVANSSRSIDMDSAVEGGDIQKILGEVLPDQTPRYEVIGYAQNKEPGTTAPIVLGDLQSYDQNKDIQKLSREGFANREIDIATKGQRAPRAKTVSLDSVEDFLSDDTRSTLTTDEGSVESAFAPVDQDEIAQAGNNLSPEIEPIAETAVDKTRALLINTAEKIAGGASEKQVKANLLETLKSNPNTATALQNHNVPGGLNSVVEMLYERAKEVAEETDYLNTFRASSPMRMPSSESAAKFSLLVSAIRSSGGDVILYESQVNEALAAWQQANGFQLTTAEGKSLIGVGLEALDTRDPNALTVLTHEAAHHFLNRLLPDGDGMRVRYQDALSRLPWDKQKWLMNPLSTDIRLIANAKPETLSPSQQAILAAIPAEKLAKLQQMDGTVLLVEQAAEHLAMLGADKQQARGLVSQVIRAVKDILYRLAMSTQRTLKGMDAVSDRLVRQFVENRWQQFINKDFASGDSMIGSLRNWIGAPATYRERVSAYRSIGGGDPRVGNLDLKTGLWTPTDFVPGDVDQMSDKVLAIINRAEGDMSVSTVRPGVTLDIASVGHTQFNTINWRTIPATKTELLPTMVSAEMTEQELGAAATALAQQQVVTQDGKAVMLVRPDGDPASAVRSLITGALMGGPYNAARATLLSYVPSTISNPTAVFKTELGGSIYIAKYQTERGTLIHAVTVKDGLEGSTLGNQISLQGPALDAHLNGVLSFKKDIAPLQTEDINYTQRGPTGNVVSYTPTVQFNSDFASLNFMEEVLGKVFGHLRATLPRAVLESENPAGQFLRSYLMMKDSSHPRAMKAGLIKDINGATDPLTGQKVAFNAATTISDLKSTIEQNTTVDGKISGMEINSAQDDALAATLDRIYGIANRVQSVLASSTAEYERLDKRKTLSTEEMAFKTELSERIAILKKVLQAEDVGLIAVAKDLESRIEGAQIENFYPGAHYRIPESADASPSEFTKSIIPKDLRFTPKTEQAFIKHLAKMRRWVDNLDNRKHGKEYGRMLHQFTRMNEEFSTTYVYSAVTGTMRKSFFSSISQKFRDIGTPAAKHASRVFYKFQEKLLRYQSDSRILGSRWSSTYQGFSSAMGRVNDESFRGQVWDAINRVFEQINEGEPGAVKLGRSILSKHYGIEIADGKQLEAFQDLVRATKEGQRWRRAIFEELGLKVSDTGLVGLDGKPIQRRLLGIGYFGGQRTASQLIDSLYLRMKERWSDTQGADGHVLSTLGGLLESSPEVANELVKVVFNDAVIHDFVEPLIRNNARFITLTDEFGTTDRVSLGHMQLAWKEGRGDVIKFAQALHKLEGRGETPVSQTINDVMNSFLAMFGEIKGQSEKRSIAEANGMEVSPRQMMDARMSDNWPAEWVSYSKYDTTTNFVFATQAALNASFGRNGFGAGGEFHSTMSSIIENIRLLKDTEASLRSEGLTPAEVKAKMGADQYRIAMQADDHLYMLRKMPEKLLALTKTTGYLLADFKLFTDLLNLQAGAILQNTKSAGMNYFDLLAPLSKTKLSTQSFQALKTAFSSVFSGVANSLGELMGKDFSFNTEAATRRKLAGAKDCDLYVSRREKHADTLTRFERPDRPQSLTERTGRNISIGIRGVKDLFNLGRNDVLPNSSPNALAPKFRPFGIFSYTSLSVTDALIDALYHNISDLAIRGVQSIESRGSLRAQEEYVGRLEAGIDKLDPRDLGYARKWLILNDKAAYDYLSESLTTKMGERSIEDFVAKAWRRMHEANGDKWEVITDKQFASVANVATAEYSIQANAVSSPIDMLTNPLLRFMSVFLMWSWNAMNRSTRSFRNAQEQLTLESALDGLTVLMMGIVPATLAGSMVMDFYDEKVIGKKTNLQEVDPLSLIPGVGIALQPMAALERLARYGTFGLASEAVNGVLNTDSARGSFTADTRIFVFSQMQTMRGVMSNIFQQEGEVTYQSVGRPLLQFMGLNGALQYTQIANHTLGLNNIEAQINERISVGNYLRAGGRSLDLPVRIMRGPMSIPSPITPYIQQMELAATTDDYSMFREAYARAIQQAAKAGKEDPIGYVKQSLASRHPLRRIFRVMPTEGEYRDLLGLFNEQGRTAVSKSVTSYNRYLQKVGLKPVEGKKVKPEPFSLAPKPQKQEMSLEQARLLAAESAFESTLYGQ